MIEYCEYCKKKTEQVAVKNKRSKIVKAYCMKCNNLLRENSKIDTEWIRRGWKV